MSRVSVSVWVHLRTLATLASFGHVRLSWREAGHSNAHVDAHPWISMEFDQALGFPGEGPNLCYLGFCLLAWTFPPCGLSSFSALLCLSSFPRFSSSLSFLRRSPKLFVVPLGFSCLSPPVADPMPIMPRNPGDFQRRMQRVTCHTTSEGPISRGLLSLAYGK